MKKTLSLLLAAVMLLALAACGAKAPAADPSDEKPGDTMALSEIFENILTDVADLPAVTDIEITDENFESFLFISPIEGAEALASEGMISAIAHSAVLLRVPEGTDVDALVSEIETNANPRKWICVEAEKTIVTAHGNTILLVMSFTDTADAIAANFDALWA